MINRFEEFDTLISSIYKHMLKIKRREMARFGLKSTHAQCLLAMSQHPEGVTITQMVELCNMDKAAISRAVSEMESHGVILPRESADKNYRTLLKLSEKGQQIVHQINDTLHDLMVSFGYDVAESDREIHYSVLRHVNNKLMEIAQNGPLDINSKGRQVHEQ